MRKKTDGYLTLAFVVSAALLSSCATTSGIMGKADPSAEEGKATMIEVENKSLAKKVSIKSFKNRVINDLLNVQVEIANEFSSTQQFQYRFSWFDASGFEIEQESESWKPVVMHGGAVTTIQAVAPNPTAKTYKIVLRQL